MAVNRAEDKSNLIAPLIVLALVVPIAGGLIWWSQRTPQDISSASPASPDAKAYTQHLKLSETDMKATANFAGAAIVEVTGKITNTGGRILERVELNCIFYDVAGQVVLRERVPLVKGVLKPGETKAFRLPFEGIPQSWNQAMPQLVIAQISFS